jgi:hypothetical protein
MVLEAVKSKIKALLVSDKGQLPHITPLTPSLHAGNCLLTLWGVFSKGTILIHEYGTLLGMMGHTYNPSIWEAKAGGA